MAPVTRIATVGFAWLAMNAPAMAHPGHGHGGAFGLLHHLIEPQHLLAGVLALLVSVLFVRLAARALRARRRLLT